MKLLILLCLAVTALASPHNMAIDARIVGGTLVAPGEAKFMAAVETRGLLGIVPFSYTCGAVILNKNTVLTAASCLRGALAGDIRVRVGSLKRGQGGQTIRVRKFINAPGFNALNNFYNFNNLAILKLRNDITMGDQAAPIELDFTTDLTGQSVTVSGWGYPSNTAVRPTEDLYKATVPVIPWADCKAKLRQELDEKMFCAVEQNKGPCAEDQGSPAYLNDKLVGIVSASIGKYCAKPNYPTTYQQISQFKDWINANLA